MSNYAKLKDLMFDDDDTYELDERVCIKLESGIPREVAEEQTYSEYVTRNSQ